MLTLIFSVLPTTRPLIGHIHVAKTGGSFLNQLLANEYENVCGNKGYSFDFYQATKKHMIYKDKLHQKDSITRLYPNSYFSRLCIPLSIMLERGFENCDYLSIEQNIFFWQRFKEWPRKLELHLPCRDPVEHFLSQVNHRGLNIDCSTFVPSKDAHNYTFFLDRRFKIENIPSFASIKCMKFEDQFTIYPKRIGLRKKNPEAVFPNMKIRSKSAARNREQECILTNRTLRNELEKHLLETYDYYKFCSTCTSWV